MTDLNTSGVAVGYSRAVGGEFQAVMWSAGSSTPTILTAYGVSSYAKAINDLGQIVGYSGGGVGYNNLLWQSSASAPIVLTGSDSTPIDINNNGQIISQKALWQPGDSVADLNFGSNAILSAINDVGQIAGDITGFLSKIPAWWQANQTTPQLLYTTETFFDSNAFDINNSGSIIGGYDFERATLWQGGTHDRVDLGEGWALSINNHDQVVGLQSWANPLASLWEAGSTTGIDLNTLVSLSSGFLSYASNINDAGQIIAIGSNNRTYLLTPVASVPLPGAFWLFGSVLAALGLSKSNSRHSLV